MRVNQGMELALSRLADFMNVVQPELNEEHWEQWRAKQQDQFERNLRKEDIGMPLPLEISAEEAKAIHIELHQVLYPLCAGSLHFPEGIETGLRDRLHVPTSTLIGSILVKLADVSFEWAPRRVNAGGVLIQRGDKKERWVVELLPMSMDARKTLYYILAESVRVGAISTLKICPSRVCRKYFVTRDPRRHFCDRYCRFTFNNHQRKARKDRLTQSRKKTREEALQKARRLRDEGKPQKVLKAETGLSDRLIEQVYREL